MDWSRTLIPTAREVPADAQVLSHQLMIRAGLVRQVTAGVYDWLPLGWRAMQKICAIIREEMNAAGAVEIQMPVILPAEPWKTTKRYFNYGPLMFRLKDRKGFEMVLGPTHEEVVTELVKAYVSSYKQLPLNLYQIQQKFRDEARPRNGLLRVREFIMKDAYSFHVSLESLNDTYKAMYDAYVKIFQRCGVGVIPVEAESGPIGGDASHEFILPCDAGEDVIVRAEDGSYAANLERATVVTKAFTYADAPPESSSNLEEVHTPNVPGIEDVAKFLNVAPQQMIKTMVYSATTDQGKKFWVVAAVRGDHEVNEAKLGKMVPNLALADETAAREAGFAIGYVGPDIVNTVAAKLIIDPAALAVAGGVTGANKPDHHQKNFCWRKNIAVEKQSRATIADIRNVTIDDVAPSGSKLIFSKGIECGHVFKLGTKYTDALGATYLDEKQKTHSMIMGCYGIGPGRILVGILETLSDADGIRWPIAVAPYHVVITPIKYEGQAKEVARKLADELTARGIDVLVDDRDQRPGVKFKDADLIGIPFRIVIGDKSLAEGKVELKRREQPSAEMVEIGAVVELIVNAVKPV
jgi:prolyl-tRNA synthetase